MMEESTARAEILAALTPLAAQKFPLLAALGLRAAEAPLATLAMPPFANSAMDGYAIHADDCHQTDRELRISGEQPAGPSRHLTVQSGETIRIFTGAPLPAAVAAVVMQEDTQLAAGGNAIRILDAAKPGEFIRHAGGDLCVSQKLWAVGTKFTPAWLSLAASQGWASVTATPLPKVAILTTGSELKSPGEPLQVGDIYNSNQTLLAAQYLTAFPRLQISLHSVPDDADATKAMLRDLVATHDVLAVAGGVSVGQYDYVKPALEALGAKLAFWKVKLKPGKPFLFGKLGDCSLFGLPGNPVSAYVTSFAFLLPAIHRLAGASADDCFPAPHQVRLPADLTNHDQRPTYFRGTYDATHGQFHPSGLQESHALATLARANMLVRIPPSTAMKRDELVDGWMIGG